MALFNDLAGDRRRDILLAATELFARKGFKGTSVREIADSVGLLGGSLYHHIRSKDELFLEVHGEALRVAAAQLRAAAAQESDPWLQLRAVIRTHLEIQLDPESLTMPLMDDLSVVSPKLRSGLVAQRDEFEAHFRVWVEALPMQRDVNRTVFRLSLLTLVNNTVRWYRPGRLSATEVADEIYAIFERSRAVGSSAPTAAAALEPAS